MFTLLALISATAVLAQNKVSKRVQELIENNTQFRQIEPLTANRQIAKVGEGIVQNEQYAKMNSQVVKDVALNGYSAIELALPYKNSSIIIQLYRVEVLAENFHVDTDKETNVSFERGAHYRGIIKGNNNSLAAFNFFQGEMSGIVSADGINNLVVGKLKKPGNVTDYIIYSDKDLLIKPDVSCNTTEADHSAQAEKHARNFNGTMSMRCVAMYFEIDHDIYLENEADVVQTNNWMAAVYNNVQTLFDNDGITTALKSTFIWTTPDPYTGQTSFDYLLQFNEMRPFFDGDLGQLIGIDPGGLGGVAATAGGLCSDYNFSYSDVDIEFDAVPLFSWTIQVITHELGHLLGSGHTHGCAWNGNNTSIDGCGTSAGYPEGDCPTGPIPANGGTIMSYCHLVNAGINFANGFGIQPAARIIDHIDSSACVSTDCINTCVNGVVAFAVNTTVNSATVTWTDISTATSWEVSVAPFAGTFTTWHAVSTNSYTANNLAANTYYKIAIRPACTAGATGVEEVFIFATNPDNVCNGVSFRDTGGLGANYSNNQKLLRTYKPDAPGMVVRVAFTLFNVEQGADFMNIYNGPDASYPLLATLTGNTGSVQFESTAVDGSLTFEFISNAYTTMQGWVANIRCQTLSLNSNSLVNLHYYPNPTNGLLNISSGDTIERIVVYNVSGQVLTDKEISGTETQVDIAPFADGVYFFKVSGNGKESNFRIIKQN